MNRRGYLTLWGAVVAASIPGCADLRRVEDGNTDAIPGYHVSGLEDAGVGVTEASLQDGDAVIEYTTTRTGDAARSQVGTVATAIADAIADPPAFETAVGRILVTGYDTDDEPVIHFAIEVSDAIAYSEGELDEDEYVDGVRETVQLKS